MTKGFKRISAVILIIAMVFGLYPFEKRTSQSLAATNPGQPPVEKLIVDPIHNTPPNDVQPAIGYNQFDGNYFDLKWDLLKNPNPNVAQNKFINMYLQEITKPYKPSKQVQLIERDISGSDTSYRMKNLNSGTIYTAYAKAYYNYPDGNTTYTSLESQASNPVKVLTDISLNAYSSGTDMIKLEWDDVWNVGKRIDYKLYVSEESSFSSTPPIYIRASDIGAGGPVSVNEATGMLEYTHKVRDSGRVYYVKLEPDISEENLNKNSATATIQVSSFIMAKVSKMSNTDTYSIWKLDWSPVVTGITSSNISISYQIYRGIIGSNSIPSYMAAVNDTSFYLTVATGDEGYYYIIRAMVIKDGSDLYPGVRIESDKILLKESEVPAYPPVVELVDTFERIIGDVDTTIISYQDSLKPDSATMLWRVPKKGNEQVDRDVRYDIWLVADPNLLDNPPPNTKIADNLSMGASNNVLNGNMLIGYKFVLGNLTPNATYYFKIIAKKTFMEYKDNNIQAVVYASEPALRVIITPTLGPIDQPKAPPAPPLSVKRTSYPNGKDIVSSTAITITLKNKWYESFDSDTGKWAYIRTERYEEDDTPDFTPDEDFVDDAEYRMVSYDNGVTLDVGCIEFKTGMSYQDIKTMPANKIMGFPVKANDPKEISEYNPDGEKHNIDIVLPNLNPNTTYLIWVRAARQSVNLISEPSDPIVVTTNPIIADIPEKPTVPVINYGVAGDTFADIGWDVKQNYGYTIKYGLTDDVKKAGKSIVLKPADLLYQNFYRVDKLNPGTLYYFFIQATSGPNLSEWSDSLPLRTTPYLPPATPLGFGVKNTDDAVQKNAITFEWASEEGLDYILQIATDIDYLDMKEYNCGTKAEYKVEGLRSNVRYYARLIANDSKKKMRSNPTQSITVRTARSKDEFDSDQDIENTITGDIVVKDPLVINYQWNIKVNGVNADRLVEKMKNDRFLDYRIDLRNPPSAVKTLTLVISGKVFEAMDTLKENLVIETLGERYVLRSGAMALPKENLPVKRLKDYDFEINLTEKNNPINSGAFRFKYPIKEISLYGYDLGANKKLITAIDTPILCMIKYSDPSWYKEGTTLGARKDPVLLSWDKLSSEGTYDVDNAQGSMTFDIAKPGEYSVADVANNFFDDIAISPYRDSINRVAGLHPLKSVEGRDFRPDDALRLADAVKFILDVRDYAYEEEYLGEAVRAGLISAADATAPDLKIPMDKSIAMIARLYEIKTGQRAVSTGNNLYNISDIGSVNRQYLEKVKFAGENGLLPLKDETYLYPAKTAQRGEFMAMMDRLLTLCQE